jgi:hypothetical protein
MAISLGSQESHYWIHEFHLAHFQFADNAELFAFRRLRRFGDAALRGVQLCRSQGKFADSPFCWSPGADCRMNTKQVHDESLMMAPREMNGRETWPCSHGFEPQTLNEEGRLGH